MKKRYSVQDISFTHHTMSININGRQLSFPLGEISQKLLKASQIARETFEVSPSGYGIHWPVIDEDLSIPGLLKIVPQEQKIGA